MDYFDMMAENITLALNNFGIIKTDEDRAEYAKLEDLYEEIVGQYDESRG